MPFGQCGLCREERDLRSSHLLPAGVYAIVRRWTAGEHPVFMTLGGSFFTDAEVQAHLLCDEHELLFSQRGEDWTPKNCWRSPTEFRLQKALERAVVLEVEPDHYIFAGREVAGVDMRQLIYF